MLATRRPWGLLAVVALAATSLAGCGGEDTRAATTGEVATQKLSGADKECRSAWRSLSESLEGRAGSKLPSALAPRWNTVIAGADYYAVTASAKDCGAPLRAQRAEVDALDAFGSDLEDYDFEVRLVRLTVPVQRYLADPLPKPTTTGRGAKKKTVRPPAKKQVRAALKTLRTVAAQVPQTQKAGWQQANATDPADKATRAKALDDLHFLTGESTVGKRAESAVATLDTAVEAAG